MGSEIEQNVRRMERLSKYLAIVVGVLAISIVILLIIDFA
jgi:hypothetical protein